MEKIKLSVPFSCTESWDNMHAVHQGRHCGVCQTTVYDFAAMSDAEITAFFQNYKGEKLCGRIVETAAAPSFIRKIANRSFTLRAIFVGLSLMASINSHVRAGNISPNDLGRIPTEQNLKIGEIPAKHNNGLAPHQVKHTFMGRVSNGKEVVTAAKIQVFIDNKQVAESMTDINGDFFIDAITHALDKEFYIKITHNKRRAKTPLYKITEPMQPIIVDLERLNRKVGRVKSTKKLDNQKIGIIGNPKTTPPAPDK